MQKILLIMLFALAFSAAAYAQNRTVSGKVTGSDDGLPLPQVSVLLKGTTTGVPTNIDGEYRISVPAEGGTLVFSFLGYVTQEVEIGSQSVINVILAPDVTSLEDAVVVGYGAVKKESLTGSVAQLDLEANADRPGGVQLQGNLPGVTVVRGQGPIIRGLSTINNSAPIVVIDGVLSSFAAINPTDIKSINVLKDAASASIYGARAAGGVILIETKKGEPGKMRIAIDSYYGFKQVDNSRLPQLLNAKEYADVRNLAAKNANKVPELAHNALLNPRNQITRTDWLDAIFRTATDQSYSVALSGASEKSNYYSSVRYTQTEGVQLNNYGKSLQLRLRSEHELGEYTRVGQNLNFGWNKGLGTDAFRSALYYPRSAPVYNPDGTFSGVTPENDPFGGGAFPDLRNPVADLLRGNFQGPGNTSMQFDFFAETNPLEGLTLKSMVGYGRQNGYSKSFSVRVPEPGLPNPENSLRQGANVNQNLLWETTLNYKKTFGNLHNVDLLAGYTVQQFRNEGLSVRATDFDNEKDNSEQYLSYAKKASVNDIGGSYSEEGIVSYLARLNYDYDGKYFLSSSIRRDGTSRLTGDLRWGIFPSVSAAWLINKEDFLQDIGWISLAKFRAGWGSLGNVSSLSRYPSRLSVANTRFPGIVGADVNSNLVQGRAIDGIENKDLKWETVSSLNFAVDMGFFDNRLTFTAEYFVKTTKDMIVQPPLAGTAGVNNAPFLNIGNVENKGFEFILGLQDRRNDFYYAIDANIATVQNTLTSFSDVTQKLDFNDNVRNTLYPIRAVVGNPVFSYYVIPTDGIFRTDQEAAGYVDKNNRRIQPEAKAGDLKFVDTNGDGIINDNDRVYKGDPFPDFSYGLNVKVGYKNIDLTIFAQGVQNVDLYAGYRMYSQNASLFPYNHTRDILNAWSPENPSSTIPQMSVEDRNNNFTRTSDYYIEDGSYMRIKALTLGYNLPESLLSRMNINRFRVYLTGQNLFTFTKYKGSDPEIGRNGIDQGIVPIPRTLVFGLSVGF